MRFTHIAKLLIGSGKEEKFNPTPINVLLTAWLVALAFLGSIFVLLFITSLIIK